MFMVKRSLSILSVCYNNIGDDGIAAIAGALGNSWLDELDVGCCGITYTGAKSLAEGLLVTDTLVILKVYGNPITKKGAHLLLQSAKLYTKVWLQEGSPSTTADDYVHNDYWFDGVSEDDETRTEEETSGRKNLL